MKIDIQTRLDISSILAGGFSTKLDQIMQAGMSIVEQAYVREAPGDSGDFKKGIQIAKDSLLKYRVKSTALNTGAGGDGNYVLNLYEGTGRLKGARDYGYTTGRVRDGDVAYGIGGVRPNKAALRARKSATPKYLIFIKDGLRL